jgi:Skp family chaperone for outer membrane proteins
LRYVDRCVWWIPVAAATVSLAAAQVAADDEEGPRIGIIVVERLVRESPDYARAEEAFTRAMTDRTALLEAKRSELQTAQEAVISGTAGLDTTARAGLVQAAEDLQVEVDRMTTDIQTDLAALREELLAPVYDQVDEEVVSYIEEFGFDLVLDGSSPSLGLVFLDGTADITDAILARMRTGSPDAEPRAEPPEER